MSDNVEPQQTASPVAQQTAPVKYPSTLQDLDFKGFWGIQQSSLGQVVRGIVEMQSRVTEESAKDDFQKVLFQGIRDIAQNLVSEFEKLTVYPTPVDRRVRGFNLFGYDGRVTKEKDGNYPVVNGIRPGVCHTTANMGDYLRMLDQRTNHIVTREMPERYNDKPEEAAAYNSMRQALAEFLQVVQTANTRWIEVVRAAREASGQPQGPQHFGGRGGRGGGRGFGGRGAGRGDRPHREYTRPDRQQDGEQESAPQQFGGYSRQSQPQQDGEQEQVGGYSRGERPHRDYSRPARPQQDGEQERGFGGRGSGRGFGGRGSGRGFGGRGAGRGERPTGYFRPDNGEQVSKYDRNKFGAVHASKLQADSPFESA